MASVFSKPSVLPTWATDPSASVETPPAEKQGIGWQDGELPPAGFMNWLFAVILGWILYLMDFERNAHTWMAAQTFSGGLTSNVFTYSTAKTGAVILYAPDLKSANDAGTGAAGLLTVINGIGTFNPVWHNEAGGATYTLAAVLRVPQGCTLTSCKVLASNNETTDNKLVTVIADWLATDLGGQFAAAVHLWQNGQATIVHGVDSAWYDCGAPTNSPALGTDGIVLVRVTVASVTAGKAVSLYGVRFGFSQPAVSPSL